MTDALGTVGYENTHQKSALHLITFKTPPILYMISFFPICFNNQAVAYSATVSVLFLFKHKLLSCKAGMNDSPE